MVQVAAGWIRGPLRYTAEGGLIIDSEETVVNPAYRLGAQQPDELGAVDDLRRSITNYATVVHAPIHLPSWDPIVQMCDSPGSRGESRPLALARADPADAYRQLQFSEAGVLVAAVTLPCPRDGRRYDFIPRTQLFGSAAAVPFYNCLSRVVASPACRYLIIPCIGFRDDFGIVAPKALLHLAFRSPAMLRGCTSRGKVPHWRF